MNRQNFSHALLFLILLGSSSGFCAELSPRITEDCKIDARIAADEKHTIFSWVVGQKRFVKIYKEGSDFAITDREWPDKFEVY